MIVLTWLSRNVFTGLGAALDVVEVPGLVELAVLAVERDFETVLLGDGGLDLGERVGLRLVGHDAGIGEGLSMTS